MKSLEEMKETINKKKEHINKLQEENHENDFSLEIAKAALDMAKNEFILAVTQGISINRLETICNAEREDRCVALPCKVGDAVYLIIHGFVEETKVRTFFVGHPSYNRGEPDPRYEMIRCTNFDLPMKDFDKTVFLTRADAEKALKEREQNG